MASGSSEPRDRELSDFVEGSVTLSSDFERGSALTGRSNRVSQQRARSRRYKDTLEEADDIKLSRNQYK